MADRKPPKPPAVSVEEYVAKNLAAAPPLDQATRDQLYVLLRPVRERLTAVAKARLAQAERDARSAS